MRNIRISDWRRAGYVSATLLSLSAAVIAVPGTGAAAAVTAPRASSATAADGLLGRLDLLRHPSAALSTCDPADLPGGAEGPDNDGDECNFTITGKLKLPPVSTDPSSEFASGSPQLARMCDPYLFQADERAGVFAEDGFNIVGATNAASLLSHFLGGSGTSVDYADGSSLSIKVKADSQFQAADKAFQQAAKALLDGGQQGVDITSSLHTVDFSVNEPPNSDPRWSFGGTQGLDVQGSGYQQNGRYVGTITYTIRDVYGFYPTAKFLGWGPKMHYLQGICGAPYYKGGAHWFYDSVTVTVPFKQPIG